VTSRAVPGAETAGDPALPPQRGWRYHLRHQTRWSRAHLIASVAINAFFFLGVIVVLSSYGWSRVCPEDATRIECSSSDPLAAGLQSQELTTVLQISLIAAALIAIAGIFAYKRMPTRSARETVVNAAVLATQPMLLAGLLLWFQGTDVDRFARNFLNFSLIGQRAGLAWDDFVDDLPALVGTSALWATVAAAATAAYVLWRQQSRRRIVIAAVGGAIAGFVWALIGSPRCRRSSRQRRTPWCSPPRVRPSDSGWD
jgi:hypothetical protein